MLLVGQLDSPFVRRVAVSMNLLRIPFERSTLSVFKNADDTRAFNPLVRAPNLVLDSGEVLIDSSAIIDYLDEQVGPERALIPPAGTERRLCLRLISFALGAAEKAAQIVYERGQRPADKVFANWIERCHSQINGALATLEKEHLSPWLLGPTLTQADVTVGCMLGYLGLARPLLEVDFPDSARFPTLTRLSEACEALPAFRDAYPPPGERPPGL